jgi:acyl carrier protein
MDYTNNDLKLKQIIANVFETNVENINEFSSKDTLDKWDSIHHMNLILALEDAFGIQLSDEEVVQLLSIKLIEIILEKKGVQFEIL